MFSIIRQKVSAKIIAGYLIPLLLMIAIALLAIFRLEQIRTTVDAMSNRLAVEQQLAQQIDKQILLTRYYANRFARTTAQVDLDQFNATFTELEALLARASRQMTDGERATMLQQSDASVRTYRDAFQQITELIRANQRVQSEVIDSQDWIIDTKLSALRIHMNAINQLPAFLVFGHSSNTVQMVRLNVSKYLDTHDSKYAVLAGTGYQLAQLSLSRLRELVSDPVQQQNVADVRSALDRYYAGFQQMQNNTITAAELFSTGLDVATQEVSETAGAMTAGIEQAFATQNRLTAALVEQTRWVLWATTITALLIGLGASILIARRITRPLQQVMQTSQQIANVDLQRLTTQLQRLSQGDIRLGLAFTAQPLPVQTQDEVGQMATAFNEIIVGLQANERAFQGMATYLQELAAAAGRVGDGDLHTHVHIRSSADMLGNAVASMINHLRENERLKAENLRLNTELDVTRRLQQMILPKAEELRQMDKLDIAGYMAPADEVGGDYYDVLRANGQVKIGIGDVTDHGLESGVVMLMTQTAVRTLLNSGEHDPVRFLDILNRTVYANVQRMQSDRNLTLALLDYAGTGTGGAVRLSGQHEEMIVVRKDGAIEIVETSHLGFPIGLDGEIADFISHTTVELDPGDGLVLYTDGITEAENLANEQYGSARLCAAASRHWAAPAEAIKDAIIADLRQHIGSQEVFDDITLLVVKQK